MIPVGTPGELGRAVHDARVKAGLTQAELASRAAVSRRWLIELERGHSNAQLAKVFVVLRALDLGLALVEAPAHSVNALDDFVEESFR